MEDIVEIEDTNDATVKNLPYVMFAVATKDYEDFGVIVGDVIGDQLFFPNGHLPSQLSPVYSLIEHEWVSEENFSEFPQVKSIDI